MKKQSCFAALLLLSVLLTVGAACASDSSVTDSYATSLVDDTEDVSIYNGDVAGSSEILASSVSNVDNGTSKVSLSSEEVLESDNSNTLSTNTNSNSAEGITNYAAYSDVVASESALTDIKNDDNTILAASNDADMNSDNNDILAKSNVNTKLVAVYEGDSLIATLTDENGNPVSGAKIGFANNGVTYIRTDKNGKAVYSTKGLKAGIYTVKIKYYGDDTYSESNQVVTKITVKTDTVLTSNYANGVLVATLKDANGKAVSGAKVGFANNGVKYILTDANGQAKYSTGNLATGTYTVKMKFYGNDAYRESNQLAVKISVNKLLTTLTTANVNVYSGADSYLVATLKDGNGRAVSGAKVGFANNGVKYFVTDANGQAKYSTSGLAVGTYTVKMKFYGNDGYLESNQATAKVTVLKKVATELTCADVSVEYGSDEYLVATLKDGNGNPVSDAKVGFANNGVKYVLTDKNGQAKYSTKGLALGTYTVKMKFYGNDAYQESNQVVAKLTVLKKVATTLTCADVNVEYGSDGYLVATLKDANGNPVKGVKVGFANNGVKYFVTDANGQAKYSLSGLAVGTYTVKMKFYGSDAYKESNQAVAKVVVSQKGDSKYESGYFLFGADMKNVDLKSLADLGTTNIFLNYYAFEKHGESAVVDWIASANKLGIKVHIWMQAFYEGSWVNPIVNGKYNQEYANEKIAEAKYYAGVKGVSGILLDYLRYPGTAYKTEGGTDAISKFAKSIADEVHKINKNIIVSGAIMPETTSNAYYYGQDYSALSSSLDVVMPMIYKGNYGKSTDWIKTTAKWFADNSKGAKVWSVLQAYKSDDDTTKLPVSELTTDIKNALAGGSSGVILFRYGLSNLVDFNKISGSSSSSSSSSKPASISINDVLAGAETLKNYYSKNNKFPNTVTAAGYAFTMPEFLYLMDQAIYQLVNSNNAAIKCIYGVGAPSSPSGDAINTNLYRNDYAAVANSVASFIRNNNVAPNYATSTAGKIMYSVLLDASSRILTFYKNNDKYMPNYVAIKTNGGSSSSSSSSSSNPTSVSINDILTGATTLKNYYSSKGTMPKTVTVAGHAFTMPEFLYLMSQAAYQLGSSDKSAIKCIYGVKEAGNPTGDTINAQLLRNDYLTVAKNLANYIKTNNQAPNYGSSAVGKISYNVMLDAFSRILAFYKANDEYMPNYVTIVQGSGSSSSSYTTGGMNVRNTITNLDPYYQSTANCPVGNSAIKSLVNSLTAGLTSDKEKATVLFNYVRDQVAYSYYYDTQKGAVGTLNAKSGNCVDQAHLLIAMYRTAGLAARYEHGTCYFPLSGNTYGHVWTQVLIDNVWVVGDPTSNRNSFGNVISWNTNSYTHKAYYASLPF